ncbi:MAG: DUF433 domain-containing protein [Dehalococcoidia bacterium]
MSTDTPVDISTFITSTPHVQGGLPCIVGTRIPVRQIAAMHLDGLSAEAIAEEFPAVPLGHVHAALAYYLANREGIEADLAAEVALYERLASEQRQPGS